jgi:hypothetical protein
MLPSCHLQPQGLRAVNEKAQVAARVPGLRDREHTHGSAEQATGMVMIVVVVVVVATDVIIIAVVAVVGSTGVKLSRRAVK